MCIVENSGSDGTTSSVVMSTVDQHLMYTTYIETLIAEPYQIDYKVFRLRIACIITATIATTTVWDLNRRQKRCYRYRFTASQKARHNESRPKLLRVMIFSSVISVLYQTGGRSVLNSNFSVDRSPIVSGLRKFTYKNIHISNLFVYDAPQAFCVYGSDNLIRRKDRFLK